MGAVVLEPQVKGIRGVERFHIIDGQQRLTTLQYVLCSLKLVFAKLQNEELLKVIEQCLVNDKVETMIDKDVEPFKLWPTFKDIPQFKLAMKADSAEELQNRFPESYTKNGTLKKIGVHHPPALESILFFYTNILDWVRAQVDNTENACESVATAVLQKLKIVCITLGNEDDAQIIFETLNAHGVELNATDLIRNCIFMSAGTDAAILYETWKPFESVFWSEQESHGRLNKPRMEWYIQSVLQAETGEMLEVGRLYAAYRQATSGKSAKDQLDLLKSFSNHYVQMIKGDPSTPIGRFGQRLEGWDAASLHSLALKIAIADMEEGQKDVAYKMLMSYIVRRAVCGLTTKNYNRFFIQLLKKLPVDGLTSDLIRDRLNEGTGDAVRWPDDEEFKRHWLNSPAYPSSQLNAPKLRSIFSCLEKEIRSHKTEEPLPLAMDQLDVEHIMPQTWWEHWTLLDGSKVKKEEVANAESLRITLSDKDLALNPRVKAILEREDRVKQFGNLTLIHLGVNRSIQNGEFQLKQSELFKHSNLQINRLLTSCENWDEASIKDRGRAQFIEALKLWPGASNT